MMDSQVPIRMVNTSNESVKLGRGTIVAKLESFVHSSVQVIKQEDIMANIKTISTDPLNDIQIDNDSLTSVQKKKLLDLLQKNKDLFGTTKNPGQANVTPHAIVTDGSPIKQRAYRVSQMERDYLIKEIKELLQNHLIRPSSSAWAAPIVLVRKKDGTIRFCVDYRKLNKVTQRDVYPLPRIDDILDRLGNAKFFSSMDLASGYWQIGIQEEDKHKTAFASPIGLFEWNVMPFGLTNAPATFQRAMDMVLGGLKWEVCLVYLDDIMVFSSTFDKHLEDLQTVFDRLRDVNFKLKATKCHFVKEEILYLGYVVSKDGIKPDPKKIAAMTDYPQPKKLKDIRSFLGLCNYYRRFVPNFSEIAEPLFDLTRKHTRYVWTNKC
jgi:hypothetical protein